jgi:hypothetical protein
MSPLFLCSHKKHRCLSLFQSVVRSVDKRSSWCSMVQGRTVNKIVVPFEVQLKWPSVFTTLMRNLKYKSRWMPNCCHVTCQLLSGQQDGNYSLTFVNDKSVLLFDVQLNWQPYGLTDCKRCLLFATALMRNTKIKFCWMPNCCHVTCQLLSGEQMAIIPSRSLMTKVYCCLMFS